MLARKTTPQGQALYRGKTVYIMDAIAAPIGGGRVEYMINWGGPKWVLEHELMDIVWIVAP